jgi:hypothetical protein
MVPAEPEDVLLGMPDASARGVSAVDVYSSAVDGRKASCASAADHWHPRYAAAADGFNAAYASAIEGFRVSCSSSVDPRNTSCASAIDGFKASCASAERLNASYATAADSFNAMAATAYASAIDGVSAIYAEIAAACADHLRSQLRLDAAESARQLSASFGPFQPGAEELVRRLLARSSTVIQEAAKSFSSTVFEALESEQTAARFEPPLSMSLLSGAEPFAPPYGLCEQHIWLRVARVLTRLFSRQLHKSHLQLQRAYSCAAAAVLRARGLPERTIAIIASLRHARSCCRSKAPSSDDEDSNSLPSESVFGHYRKGRRDGDEAYEFRTQYGSPQGQAPSRRRSPLGRQVGRRDSTLRLAGAHFFSTAGAFGRCGVGNALNRRRRTRASVTVPHQRYPAGIGRRPAARPRRAMRDGAYP